MAIDCCLRGHSSDCACLAFFSSMKEDMFRQITEQEAKFRDLRCDHCYIPDDDGCEYCCGDSEDLFEDDGRVLCRKHVASYVGGAEKLSAFE